MNEYYDSTIFANNLKKLLREREITLTQFAERVGVAKSTASDWVNGKKLPRMDKVEIIAAKFNITKSHLLEKDYTPPVHSEIESVFMSLSKSNQYKLLAYGYELKEKEAAAPTTTSSDVL